MPSEHKVIRILLVEDDEDDYVIFRENLSNIKGARVHLDWAAEYEEALNKATQTAFDIFFVDYRLGEHNGLELLRAIGAREIDIPVIILTGYGDYEIDVKLMKEGAADYLEKEYLNASLLERSIRYALERDKAIKALNESQRQLRLLSTKLLDAQENERKAVAQELHDSIGAGLSAIKFALEQKASEEKKKQEKNENEGISLGKVVSMVRSVMEEIHNISIDLRPPLLDNLGMLPTIRAHCREFQEVYPDIGVETQVDVQEQDIPDQLKIVIFRIMQEALNNVAKYSEADQVKIFLRKRRDGLEMTLEDNGKGFDLGDVFSEISERKNMGLSGMRERAELSNGTLAVISGQSRGTLIRAFWPDTGQP